MGEMNTMRFVLVGPHAGKTIKLGKYRFIDGVHEHTGSPGEVGGAARYLRKSYNAHLEGSKELTQAQELYERLLAEADDGKRDLQESPELDSADSVPSDVSSPDDGDSEDESTDDGGSDDAEAGDPGLRSEGDDVREGREETDDEE
jgi:hypothetical protein